MPKRRRHILRYIVIIFFVIIAIIYIIIQFIRPTVTVKNNTGKTVYLFILQSQQDKEPTIAELDEWKGHVKLNPLEEKKIQMSLKNVITNKKMRLDIGWSIDNPRLDAQGNSVGFIIDNKDGVCNTHINITLSSYKMTSSKNNLCYKKLKYFAENY